MELGSWTNSRLAVCSAARLVRMDVDAICDFESRGAGTMSKLKTGNVGPRIHPIGGRAEATKSSVNSSAELSAQRPSLFTESVQPSQLTSKYRLEYRLCSPVPQSRMWSRCVGRGSGRSDFRPSLGIATPTGPPGINPNSSIRHSGQLSQIQDRETSRLSARSREKILAKSCRQNDIFLILSGSASVPLGVCRRLICTHTLKRNIFAKTWYLRRVVSHQRRGPLRTQRRSISFEQAHVLGKSTGLRDAFPTSTNTTRPADISDLEKSEA